MSISKDQANKAASVNLDDDEPFRPGAPAAARPPRTAPGQLMDLQGKYRDAQAAIERLEKGGNAMELPLSRIIRVPGRQRPLTADERAELKVNLDVNPLIHPVVVLPETEDGYELFSGYNRVELYEELGRSTILAVVRDVPADRVEVLAFYANLLAPSLPDFKKYEGLKARQVETGFTLGQLSEESGMSTSSISRLLKFETLPHEAIQVLEKNPFILGATAAESLAKATEAGRGNLVIEAVIKLAEARLLNTANNKTPRFTEDNAVAHANGVKPAAAKAAPLPPMVVKQGKSHFAKLVVRGDQVTIKFSNATTSAGEWAGKFESFMKSELVKMSESD